MLYEFILCYVSAYVLSSIKRVWNSTLFIEVDSVLVLLPGGCHNQFESGFSYEWALAGVLFDFHNSKCNVADDGIMRTVSFSNQCYPRLHH